MEGLEVETEVKVRKGQDLVQIQERLLQDKGIALSQDKGISELLGDEERDYQSGQLTEYLEQFSNNNNNIEQVMNRHLDVVMEVIQEQEHKVEQWLFYYLQLIEQAEEEGPDGCIQLMFSCFRQHIRKLDEKLMEQNNTNKDTQVGINIQQEEQRVMIQQVFQQLVFYMHSVYILKREQVSIPPLLLQHLPNFPEDFLQRVYINRTQPKQGAPCQQLQLCLGGQKKYKFQVQLVLKCLGDLVGEQDYSCALLQPFSAGQVGCVNILPLDTSSFTLAKGWHHLQHQSDYLFPSIYQQLGIHQNITPLDLVTTRHSNIGCISYVYHLHHNTPIDIYQQLFSQANNNFNRQLIFPLELLIPNSQSTLEYGQRLLSLLQTIKQQLNTLAHHYTLNHSLKSILILIPSNLTNSLQLYDQSRELLKSAFQ